MPWRRRNPFEEIEELVERMGEEFDVGSWRPGPGVAVDVADHGDRYVVTVDLPGYAKADIDLRLADGTLAIDAVRSEPDDEDVDYLRQERRRSVSRRLALPAAVDEAGTSATYRSGVLTVELPKAEVDEGSRIDVE